MSDTYLIPVYLVLIVLCYIFYAWLLRRIMDPDGSFRELPLPWVLRWPAFIMAIFTPIFVIWVLSLVVRGLTWLVS